MSARLFGRREPYDPFVAIEAKPPPAPIWRLALGGVPDFLTAWTLWIVWNDPARFGYEWVKRGELTVLLEFFVIHACGFYAAFGRSLPGFLGLSAFYLMFIVSIALSTESMWLLSAFGWLLFSKLQMSVQDLKHARFALHEQFLDWPFAVVAWLGSLVIGMAAVEVPRRGITREVFDLSGLAGAGLFEDQPWRALAAGVLYFSLMGLYRLRLWRWFRRTSTAPAAG